MNPKDLKQIIKNQSELIKKLKADIALYEAKETAYARECQKLSDTLLNVREALG